MDWTTANPVLADGEPGIEKDTGRFKLGDGATAWADLPYAGGLTSVKASDITDATTTGQELLTAADAATALAAIGGATSTQGGKADTALQPDVVGAADGVAGLDASQKLLEVNVPDRLSDQALAAAIASAPGGNIGRFLRRAQAGQSLTITGLGDSVMAGQTVTNPATDGYMILLAQSLSSRFGTTITQNNRAVGGRTLLTAHTFGDVATALADKADLYIISYAKNDSQIYFGTQGGSYGPGYPRAYSIAAMERIIRRIRDQVPQADILLCAENPYATSDPAAYNSAIQSYHQLMRNLAAVYGCEWVDTYQPFIDLGDYSTYLASDGVHPNTAGHKLMADTLLTHFPAKYAGPAPVPARPARLSVFSPGQVDGSKNYGGYGSTGATGSSTGFLTWTNTGTGWGTTNPYTTSTVGDYAEFTFTGTECHINISCRDADAPIFDVSVDGTVVQANANPLLAGGRIDYYVPVALGLTPGQHTVRVTLKSGTLKINTVAVLQGPGSDIIGDSVSMVVASKASQSLAVDSTGAATPLVSAYSVPLPAGWQVMDVTLTGFVRFYVQSTTTEKRTVKVLLYDAGVIVQNLESSAQAVPSGEFDFITFPVTYTHSGATAAVSFDLKAFMVSTVKTNTKADEWQIKATCRRIA